MVFVNYLGNALPINGLTTGQVSANFDNLFTPAGFAFSIWGIIYLLLLAFSSIVSFRKRTIVPKEVLLAFVATCFLNSLWVFAWHYQEITLSVLIMLGLLALLVFINFKLRNSESVISKASFGIYLGWICVATIANITILLVSTNWNGWGVDQVVWTVIMIAAGTLIGSLAKFQFSNLFIALPIVWAFFAIYSRRIDDFPVIAISSLVAILILAVLVVWFWLRPKRVLVTNYQ